MLHKPVERKLPKKYNQDQRPSSVEKPKMNHIQKTRQTMSKKHLTEKNINQPNIPKLPRVQPNKSIPHKVEQLQKAIEKLSVGINQPEMQRILLEEIKGIKSELREIKQQIGLTSSPPRQNLNNQPDLQKQQEIQGQNIANLAPRQYQEIRTLQPEPKRQIVQIRNNSNLVTNQMSYQINQKKQLLDIGKIQPYMKQFKLQQSKISQPIYKGYHKKSSKPIVIKYCREEQSMQPQINLYQKLWKNMVKAKKVCINKIYEINEPLAHYILALQMNRCELKEIQLDKSIILKDVLRGIQFMHQCDYIYRDLHPQHVMQSFEGNIVFVGLKRMKKYMDLKGRILEVRGNAAEQGLHQFVSNARLRGMPQGRKDDLQTIGYLALYLLQGKLPWSLQNMIQARSKVTLQQLYGKYKGLFEYMVTVHKMSNDQQPNYEMLHNLIAF